MLLMKACNRCHGDLLVEEEGRFHDLVCLQCGNRPSDGAERAARIIRIRALRKQVAAAGLQRAA